MSEEERFQIIARNTRFALVCTNFEPIEAAQFFGALAHETWEPSQVEEPIECGNHDDCLHILLTRKGTALAN